MIRIITGDCREALAGMAAESVHCVVTSPPYWGLRDYGISPSIWGGEPACEHVWLDEITNRPNAGGGKPMFSLHGGGDSTQRDGSQWAKDNGRKSISAFCRGCGAWRGVLGLEPTITLYVAHMVEVFRAVRRVLRKDGTLWLNLGDSYAAQGGRATAQAFHNMKDTYREQIGPRTPPSGLKPKDLCGIPWRVAFALQDDGWYLRQDIIWAKPNPMPESITDRCTKAHEYVFLLTKSPRYFYDAEAIKESVTGNAHARGDGVNPKCIEPGNGIRQNTSFSKAVNDLVTLRNKRSVWEITTVAFPMAHFATFPPALVEPCIKAGTSERGCCAKCGAPWMRQISKSTEFRGGSGAAGRSADDVNANGKWAGQQYGTNIKLGPVVSTTTLGWSPSCSCDAAVVPCTVLDPFAGSGTVGLVAGRLQRDAILIEMSPEYIEMARRRISEDAPLFAPLG